jgi:outer membrane PBP1 activator LpoA protein
MLAAFLAASPALCAEAAAPATRPGAIITLLLPLDAPDFAPVAAAVQSGCSAALALENNPPRLDVARTDSANARIVEAWMAAASREARVIIGPLTRSGTSALAAALSSKSASTPDGTNPPVTLALNLPEDAARLPARFYTFGLPAEPEARAVARLAWIEGQRTVIVVQGKGALERRISQAFADEWLAFGGRIVDIRDVTDDTDLDQLRTQLAKSASDFVFLSGDASMARRVRPYLASGSAIYATSQVNDGRNDPGANVDLEGIRFTDMPWMLQPDHPAVMVYARQAGLAPDLQRFYALGIDACRVATQIIAGQSRIDLDGVTGHLTLNLAGDGGTAARAIGREPLSAAFRSLVDNSPPRPPEETPATATSNPTASTPGTGAPATTGPRPEPATSDMRR